MKRYLLLPVVVLCSLCGLSQNADQRYRDYISTYAPLAVEQQQIHGIPASITLAQGLLESAAGRSTLASQGNNHFGIKCHADWTGDTMLRNDDAPNECFRVYPSAADSFTDHSLFLRRKRYASLFDLPADDYAGWARGLSACGYATDPNYASRLIAIIERYALYTFDTDAGRSAEQNADYIFSHLKATHPIRRSRGLHYVIANPGDTYESLAREFRISPNQLADFNDAASTSSEIRPWEEVYLQEKLDSAPASVSSATIGEDETMRTLAQRFGIRMSTLQSLNPTAKDRPGTRLRLR